MNRNGLDSEKPLDNVPRSPSGRVPQWVIDEAQGRVLPHPEPWRSYPSVQAGQPRRHGMRRWSSGVVTALVVLGVIGAAVWLEVTGVMKPGASSAVASQPANWPKPGHEESPSPLGVPAPLAATSDSYRFLSHQRDGTSPVAYDPCRPIHYVIRQQSEPTGGAQMVADAFSRVSEATGLRFIYDGPTSESPSRQRPSYQPERYGERWAPVLISWVTAKENPDFAADVAGQGGSASVDLPDRPRAYVTGAVELDAGKLTGILRRPDGQQVVRGVVLHELGHLLGLDHVTDASQLLYPEGQPGVTEFGAGDLTGLAALGKGACMPDL